MILLGAILSPSFLGAYASELSAAAELPLLKLWRLA